MWTACLLARIVEDENIEDEIDYPGNDRVTCHREANEEEYSRGYPRRGDKSELRVAKCE